MHKNNKLKVKPFIKWVGSKSLFVDHIIDSFPSKDDIRNYYEPFVGTGSVFLSYQPKRAFLSDANSQLIETFKWVRNNPSLVSKYLGEFEKQSSENFYYKMRDEYNKSRPSCKQTARFIYLNKACFNGIFRVNTKGEFNVPYGYRKSLAIPDKQHLEKIGSLLKNVKLEAKDYKEALKKAKEGDMVYLDPPYPPINGSSYFTHYTKERFSLDDQIEVANLANQLSSRGCWVVISNADLPLVRNLYSDWHITDIERTRWVTSSKHKHKVVECVIKNWE